MQTKIPVQQIDFTAAPPFSVGADAGKMILLSEKADLVNLAAHSDAVAVTQGNIFVSELSGGSRPGNQHSFCTG